MKKKIIKGYVLYKNDTSTGENYYEEKESIIQLMWQQYMPALLKGVLVEESLEKRIKQSGLKKLKDARNESPESCFKRCKNNLIEVQLLASTQK